MATGKRNPQEGRGEDALLRDFMEALPAGVAILDASGRITAVNEEWKRLARAGGLEGLRSVDEGASCLDVYRKAAEAGDPHSKEILEGIKGALEGRRSHFSLDYPRHSSGEKRRLLMRTAPFGSKLVALHLDITGRKLAQEALEQRASERTLELSRANEQLQVEILERRRAEERLREALAEIERYKARLEAECLYLQDEIKQEGNFGEIIGQSDGLKDVLLKVSQIAPTDATVLILGETGTGKELVARAVHSASARSNRLLVKVNCAALPASLIESELFGHEKGAFTGAWAKQTGRFELADGGTIFLDEIGELPLELQAKLLRVLQDREFERVGNPRTFKTDVRVIAATNRNLEKEAREGRFRRDLWYRINVFPITIPPLRQRREDIPLMAQAFAARFARKLRKGIAAIPDEAMEMLQAYSWPGNIRELENVIERAVISSSGPLLRISDKLAASPLQEEGAERMRSLEDVEREHLVAVLERTRWRIEGEAGAAKILGLHPSTLRGRLRKLGLHRS